MGKGVKIDYRAFWKSGRAYKLFPVIMDKFSIKNQSVLLLVLWNENIFLEKHILIFQ